MPQATANELSGTVVGPSVQASIIHGGVHVTSPAAPGDPIPRQLPAPSAYFTGRASETAELDQLLGRGANIIVLCGPGGVGKSALARKWAHALRHRFVGGQIHTDLRGFSGETPLDPGAALTAFLRALNVPSPRIPADLAEQVALYRTVTANRSLLVVLDDALSAAQVRPLVPASSSAMVVVTSRRRLTGLVPDGAHLFDVGPLPSTAAVTLLERTVGRERIAQESGPTEELVRICGGMPLALVVAGGRLASRPRLTIRRVVSELADETQRLARLSAVEGLSIRAMIEVSYQALTPPAAALFRRLALHPGPEFSAELIAATAPAADQHRVPHLIDELLEASLWEEIAEEQFTTHDLLRLYARDMSQRQDSDAERHAVRLAICEYYFAAAHRADLVVTPYRRRLPYAFPQPPVVLPTFTDRAAALAWLQRERSNLLDAGRVAFELGRHELAWHLSDAMWPLFLYIKGYKERLTVDERGLRAAQAWGDPRAEANMLKRLSRAYSKVGDQEAAERHGLAAIDRYRDAGDMQGRVDAEEGLATLYTDTGRDHEAVQLFERILEQRRALPEPDPRSTGLTCLNLAMLLTRMGQPAPALPLLAEAEKIFLRLTDIDPYNGVRVLLGVAGAELALGDLDAAEQAAAEAARRMAQLGSATERAEALDLLGQVAERRGDDEDARRHYLEAAAIFDAVGSPRLATVRSRLDRLGGTVTE
ncbi:tetratricopeptide repeat protein [Micromonospora sp. NPDC047793]|uniref:ATP-binding protein n=1 Tax=unclassified Micromonospora TaxID=2617518 RepID=UPI0033CA0DCC